MSSKTIKIFNKIRYSLALSKVERLEHERKFIDEFFCGETMFPIKLAKWEKDYEKAKAKLNNLQDIKEEGHEL